MPSLLLIAVVRVFDLIAFALAIAAELRRSTATRVADEEKNYTYCLYNNSDIATAFGVGALLSLLLSRVVIMAATSNCFCCGTALWPGGSRSCALFLFLFSWLTFLVAEVFLLVGAVQNMFRTRDRTIFFADPPTCRMVRKGVFAAGAAFIFFTAIVTELYYITFSKAQKTTAMSYGKNDIGMAPEKVLAKATKENGDRNSESVLEPLLTYLELGGTPSGNMESTQSH